MQNPDGYKLKILVVDDEFSIRDAVITSLKYENFDAVGAETALNALKLAQESHLDLIILDVMLPDLDGFEITQRLRDSGINTPILFLTARDAVEDRVRGLSIGGDDYLVKPFSLAELIARVKAILRRAQRDPNSDKVLKFADIVMNEDTHEVFRAGVRLALSPTEFKLLRLFLMNPRKVLSKASIVEAVWHYDFGGDMNIVETYVSYLRKKLDQIGPSLIHTVRLVGYILKE